MQQHEGHASMPPGPDGVTATGAPVAPEAFEYRFSVRYMEVDAQGVVFNAWYLTYFDEAMTAFLRARGLPFVALLDAGFDTQLVHAAIDWKVGLTVRAARVGRTSFAMDFTARRPDGEIACTAQIVYVVVAPDGSGKREVPAVLRQALGDPAANGHSPDEARAG
jgi:acyl-CoA thioester hydrolase